MPRVGGQRTWFIAVENWLDRERDQLPLWLPVGIGIGIVIWQFGGVSEAPGALLLAIAVGLLALLAKPHSRSRQFLGMAALASLLGFGLINLKSAAVDQPVLGKIWIGDFYGRIEAIENLTAREVVRLRLATDGSLNQLPVWNALGNMTRSRAVSACCDGPRLWRPRAVRQSLPAFECAYACARKRSAAGDSGRGHF